MSLQKEYWNNEYINYPIVKPKYDNWLDKYDDVLQESKDIQIVDLGCGRGNNSLYLVERGYSVISCDISEAAIDRVKAFIPQVETKIFDMLDGLPLESNSTKVIIADLCLHYFKWDETKMILQDIKRVLKQGGHLICRMNSTEDNNYGAGQGIKIEDNFYEVNGYNKRFFDLAQIEALFEGWCFKHCDKYQMDRYKIPKILWEVAVVNV